MTDDRAQTRKTNPKSESFDLAPFDRLRAGRTSALRMTEDRRRMTDDRAQTRKQPQRR